MTTYRTEYNQIQLTFNQNKNYKQRGFDFEKLINKIFQDKGMLITPSFRTSNGCVEQIDGAIRLTGRVLLLEIKWAASENLAESDLYAFMGKVHSKLPGTLGLFLSYNKLSQNFLNAMRNGQQQTCLVIHGKDDIEAIIDEKIDLATYLTRFYELASAKGIVELSISDYVSLGLQNALVANQTQATIQQQPAQNGLSWYSVTSDLCTDSKSVNDFGLSYSGADFSGFSNKAISLFPYLQYKDYEKYYLLLSYCVRSSKEEFERCFLDAITSPLFDNILNPFLSTPFPGDNHFFSSSFISFVEKLHLNFIGYEDKIDQYVDVLAEKLKTELGNYDNENTISRYVNILLSRLTKEQLMKLANPYFEIYIDHSRKERSPYNNDEIFENKRTANQIIDQVKNAPEFNLQVVHPVIKEKLCLFYSPSGLTNCIDTVMRLYGDNLSKVNVGRTEITALFNELNLSH